MVYPSQISDGVGLAFLELLGLLLKKADTPFPLLEDFTQKKINTQD